MSDTVGALMAAGRKHLEGAQDRLGGDLSLDARWLMASVFELPRDRVILHLSDPVTEVQAAGFWALIARRLEGEPISQITGRRSFYGREFIVERAVLDPRPETETLIETALSHPFGSVLDLGTGSGAILTTLLAERPKATGTGTDVSEAALRVAGANMEKHGVADRAALCESDWFSAVDGRFDLIISNPPYITEAAFAALDPTVRDWEPRIALTPGGDGLDAYRAICRDAPHHLRPSGRLIVEIGYDQGEAVGDLFSAAGLAEVTVHPDINGKPRVVSGRG